nr:immunoglobulin light chain junction region [Macaca mulatta]MOV94816.1 immunoglobulin light chain junction region [Macaca mulatta]MOV95967.1 immunoglobulin light chain junction region [Macaca mulatta]MOV97815.1 immunoglobulin light chain junction region [Macaca mulatta]MOW01615.1 immunoglobulin light chain junction region [Macaca mulatta]
DYYCQSYDTRLSDWLF